MLTVQAKAAQPADAVLLAYKDVMTLSSSDRYNARYLWVSVESKEEKWGAFVAASGNLNALSIRSRLLAPTIILADGTPKTWQEMTDKDWPQLTLLRVDISCYGWSPIIWDKLGDPALEPLFHVYTVVPYPAGRYVNGTTYPAGEEKTIAIAPWLLRPLPLLQDDPQYATAAIQLCIECGYAQCPILEADNFVWQSSIQFDRKAGYYDFNGIKDLKSFDKLVAFDERQSVAYAQPRREAVAKSGVANEPRLIEFFEKIGGKYIRTKDQVNQRGQGNRNALNLANVEGEFKFDAFEIYASGANGFWKKGLFDSQGTRQDSAPDGVGYHHQSLTNDGKIHVNLTCDSCHDRMPGNGGLQPFKPYYRNKYAAPGPLALPSPYKKNVDLEEQILSKIDTTGEQQRYAAAVFEVTGQTPDIYSRELLASFYRWDQHLTLKLAAQRFGVTPTEMVRAFDHYKTTFGRIDTVNDNWLLAKERRSEIGVNQWAEFYNFGQLMLRGLPTWSIDLRKKYPTKPR